MTRLDGRYATNDGSMQSYRRAKRPSWSTYVFVTSAFEEVGVAGRRALPELQDEKRMIDSLNRVSTMPGLTRSLTGAIRRAGRIRR